MIPVSFIVVQLNHPLLLLGFFNLEMGIVPVRDISVIFKVTPSSISKEEFLKDVFYVSFNIKCALASRYNSLAQVFKSTPIGFV
jgi:hypothetical protein